MLWLELRRKQLKEEGVIYPDKQKTTALAVDECAILGSGCRPTWASFRDHGLARGAP